MNSLFEHAVSSTKWIPNLKEKVETMKLGDEEKLLLMEQKLVFHLISSLVPKNSNGGFFDDPYNGLQGKINILL